MKREQCYLCKGNTKILYNFDTAKMGEYMLLKCINCHFLRISPTPDQKIIDDLYTNKSMPEKQLDNEVFSSSFLTLIKKNILIKPLINRLYKIIGKTDSPKLLDIGCSTGWITSLSKESGFEVTGLEANSYVANYGRKKYAIKIIEGFIEDLNTDEKFDAVTMFHVLEHIADPRKMLSQVHGLLDERGKLLVVIPNAGSLGVNIFKRSYNWNISHHISFFSPDTIQDILKQSGFRILKIVHLTSPPLMLYSYNRYMRNRRRDGKISFRIHNWIAANALFAPLSFIGKLLSRGEVIAVYGEKI